MLIFGQLTRPIADTKLIYLIEVLGHVLHRTMSSKSQPYYIDQLQFLVRDDHLSIGQSLYFKHKRLRNKFRIQIVEDTETLLPSRTSSLVGFAPALKCTILDAALADSSSTSRFELPDDATLREFATRLTNHPSQLISQLTNYFSTHTTSSGERVPVWEHLFHLEQRAWSHLGGWDALVDDKGQSLQSMWNQYKAMHLPDETFHVMNITFDTDPWRSWRALPCVTVHEDYKPRDRPHWESRPQLMSLSDNEPTRFRGPQPVNLLALDQTLKENFGLEEYNINWYDPLDIF